MGIKYIVRKRQLGDVLWIEPIIREAALRYKKVIVFTKYNVLFENYPYTNVVFKETLSLFEKILWKIEVFLHTTFLFINLDDAYEKDPNKHFLHAYQKAAGFSVKDEYPLLFLSDDEKNTPVINLSNYAVLHMESFSDKNYRKVYGVQWEGVCNYLKSKGFEIVQLGKLPLPLQGTTTVKTTIREMINVIYHSRFFIGIDSGPSHIAASLQKPSLVFFGAVNPLYRHFKNLFKGYFLQQFCEFAGCFHKRHYRTEPECKLVGNAGTPKCSVHTNAYVIENIDRLIKTYL